MRAGFFAENFLLPKTSRKKYTKNVRTTQEPSYTPTLKKTEDPLLHEVRIALCHSRFRHDRIS